MAGVGDRGIVSVEVDHVLAHGRAIQRAAQQADDQRQPVTLVAADGQQETFIRALGVGERLAFTVYHPAFGHHLAALCLGFHFAVGGHGGCHIEHDGRCAPARRQAHRQRVGGEQHVDATPRRQMVGAAHRHVEADHVVRERHVGIERRRACVIAPLSAHPCHARGLRFFDCALGGKFHHQMAHAIVAVHQRHACRFALNVNVGLNVNRARLDAADVLRQAKHTMAFGALHIGQRHQLCNRLRIAGRKTNGNKGAGDKRLQLRLRNAL